MLTVTKALVLILFWSTVYCKDQQIIKKSCNLNPPCKNVSTMNISLKNIVYNSPYYQPITTFHEGSITTVGACTTFFALDDDIYLTVYNAITKEGGTVGEVYLSTNIPGQPGVIRHQGLYSTEGNATTVFNDYFLDVQFEACSQFYFVYSCYFLGDSDFVYPVDAFTSVQSTTPTPPAACLDQFEQMVDQLGFTHSAGFKRACRQPPCVTRLNNNTCINAHRVDAANAISYP